MKRIRSASLALASVLAVAATLTAARPHYGGTLRVQAGDGPSARERAMAMVFETLTRFDADGGLRPVLARSWEQRGSQWSITLRDDVPLHDGSTLAPWQVAAALRAVERSWRIATDGDRLVIDPPEPVLDLPWLLADRARAIVVRQPSGVAVGTGPFRIDREDGSTLTLRAFDGYRGGRPFLNAVEIRMGRPLASQLADLEAGRADFVTIDATDARRVEQRGLTVLGSRPLTLVALAMEPNRGGDRFLRVRRTLSASLNRETIARVLLQRRADAATWIVPAWISPPPPAPVSAPSLLTRAAVAALPLDQRELVVRAEPGDPLARAIAERVAADANEAGFAVRVQVPTGLAPRPDARIRRVPIAPSTPLRTLQAALARLAPVADADADDIVDRALLIPIVHVQELYGAAEPVASWNEPAVLGSGEWNFASIWLRNVRP
jgi:ABC-type transport system substrate-binding protein